MLLSILTKRHNADTKLVFNLIEMDIHFEMKIKLQAQIKTRFFLNIGMKIYLA